MFVRLSAGLWLALVASAPALAQDGGVLPDDAQGANSGRVFVDTTVREVIVDDTSTVAVMTPSPQSPCPSDRYVFERERPKWLNTTGRMMEARREGAVLRISFSCLRGYQSINAIQFLSPPGGPAAEPAARAGAGGVAAGPAPASLSAGAPRQVERGTVPLPTEPATTAPAPSRGDLATGPRPGPLGDTGPYATEPLRAIPQP